LPSDYPLDSMATDRMEERNKFMWQVRDTCTRAEEAERKLAQAQAEGMEEALSAVAEMRQQNKDDAAKNHYDACSAAIRAKMKEQPSG